MTFNTYFRASSYAMIACGALALVVSGGLSLALASVFGVLMIVSWKLERARRWQLSERVGLIVVLLSLPLFYLDWKYGVAAGEEGVRMGVSPLAHLIIFLSTVKLLQVKADRDWLFLYLISFFEVLLAAGLSISPVFFFALCVYILCALSTIIAFEIKNARRVVKIKETRFLARTDGGLVRRLFKLRQRAPLDYGEARRLPFVAVALVTLILALALPVFLIAPRFGANAFARADNHLGNFVGFSNSVTLGDIGRLQQNDQVVMRVQVEGNAQAERKRDLRWRGIALDSFNGREWQKTDSKITGLKKNERGIFQFDNAESVHSVTKQTFFIEPLDQPVLFAAPHAVALQMATPYVYRDVEGALYTRSHDSERITYTAYSDTTEPDADRLRADFEAYTPESARYLQKPESLDPRIKGLAMRIAIDAAARTRYDIARAIEKYFNSGQAYHYTLQLKAGGEDPLADFLFKVHEGHCEYFATAMAVMLRSLGVATRIVNGFQLGEYNDAADVYTVKQRDAHSWVEVYFPGTQSWVTFDPTPAAGRPARVSAGGLSGRISKYAEALEFVWMQYVVSYDRQGQRSLASSTRNYLAAYSRALSGKISALKKSFSAYAATLRGDAGSLRRSDYFWAILLTVVLMMSAAGAFLFKSEVWRAKLWHSLGFRQLEAEKPDSAVAFYNRMTQALASRGLQRAPNETPLEFATSTQMPEALVLTRAYNRVRYGEQRLPAAEAAEIEEWLRSLETSENV
ncbi:MAG: transglutaminaseTgpA domain-containing protein [Pyrinomonadaceae bacterium]